MYDVDAICNATGVSKKIALHLLAEKRLDISPPAGTKGFIGHLTCSVCRKPISHGDMCDDCKMALSNQLTSSAHESEQKKKAETPTASAERSGPRMHVHWNDK